MKKPQPSKASSKKSISKEKNPLASLRKKLVFLSDLHAPFHSSACVSLACAFLKSYRPNLLILGGDIIDFITLSRFVRSHGYDGPQRTYEEINIMLTEVLFPLLESVGWRIKYKVVEEKEHPAFKGVHRIILTDVRRSPWCKVVFIEGNHEARAFRYMAATAQAMEGLWFNKDFFKCNALGINYVASKAGNGIYKVTRLLTAMHGTRYGLNPAKLTYGDWGASVISGHTHKESNWRQRFGCGRDDIALTSGCLSLEAPYKDVGIETRGFIAGWYEDDSQGRFGVEHVRISGNFQSNYPDSQEDKRVELFSPWGEFVASYSKKPGEAGVWTSKKVGPSETV